MKFDKETIIALLVCIGLITAWGIYSKKVFEEKFQQENSETTISQQTDNPQKDNLSNEAQSLREKKIDTELKTTQDNKIVSNTDIETRLLAPQDITTFQPEIISNNFISCEISPQDSSIKTVRFENFFDKAKKDKILFGADSTPFGALRIGLGKPSKVLDLKVEKDSAGELKIFRRLSLDDANVEVTQTFSLEGEYKVKSTLTVKNIGNEKFSTQAFSVSAGTISDFKHMAGDDIYTEYFSIDACMMIGGALKSKPFKGKDFNEKQENPARWIALSNKYFCSILLPEEPFHEGNTMKAVAPKGEKSPMIPLISSEGINTLILAPGESKTFLYSLYLGPKERVRLKNFDEAASQIMHLGWNWLEPISQLLLSFLVLLNKYLANYGLSIIVLTIIVKLLFWPITEKANASMKNMQKLQPMVLEIKEKYKNDPQKMNAKIMALYKEHGVNPLGGCLPILLQIPVFFALYNTLNGAVELRQASFLWAMDLSRPDSIFIPGIPLPINPLALAMAGTMFIQQKMTPTSADPIQQKVMMFMPLIMLVMLYNLPSGLTLYWTISQIISIIQLGMNQYIPNLKKAKGIA